MFRAGQVQFRLRSRLYRAGQSTVEYMLVVSVLVIGIYYATETLRIPLGEGIGAMQEDIQTMVDDGVVSESQ
ncbi:MAG: hypothetical protein VX519_01415 [Myxococcota bacterium]|nr:hypothetical protein [Myxococcota bacterium]